MPVLACPPDKLRADILLPGKLESEGFCCPAPSEAAGIPFCCPVGSDRAFVFVTQSVRTLLRSNCERLVIVGTCVNEPSRWHPYRSAITSLLHSSILFRPHQQARDSAVPGGGAGVLPPGSEMPIPRDSLPT